MVPNQISAVLTKEEVAEALAMIKILSERLPFLIALTPAERQRKARVGDRGRTFIRHAADVGKEFAEHLPRSLDLDEMAKDIELMDALYPLMIAMSKLAQKLVDTYRVVTYEGYQAALLVYDTTKRVKGAGAAEQAARDLGRLFSRRSNGDGDDADEVEDGTAPAPKKPRKGRKTTKGSKAAKATRAADSEQSE